MNPLNPQTIFLTGTSEEGLYRLGQYFFESLRFYFLYMGYVYTTTNYNSSMAHTKDTMKIPGF